MGLGEKIIRAIESRRDRKLKSQRGPVGDFWRNGGNDLLLDLPVTTGAIVIDAGAYKGDWTAGMIARYGCRCELYEPVPAFSNHCSELFSKNAMVRVHTTALGGSARITTFNLLDNGTSEFRGEGGQVIKAQVVDVASVFNELASQRVACVKLNIEGGEYEVLERLLEMGQIMRCDSLLIQFHHQPPGYEARYHKIVNALQETHIQAWCYPMVWEQWQLKQRLRRHSL